MIALLHPPRRAARALRGAKRFISREGKMTNLLSEDQRRDMLKRGFTRRNFGRIAAMIGGAAAMPFYNEPALAQLSRVDAPPDSVFINSNENPLGPCKEALEAAHQMVIQGGRYRFGEADKVVRLLAEQES